MPTPHLGDSGANTGLGRGIRKGANTATDHAVGSAYDTCCRGSDGSLRSRLRRPRLSSMNGNPAKVDPRKVVAFELVVIIPTFMLGGFLIAQNPGAFQFPRIFLFLLMWAAVIGLVELLPVPAWRGLTISVGFPLLMVVAFLYEPAAAAAVALVGASDPREFRGEVTLLRALFNRSQVALSVLAASAVFHGLTPFDHETLPDSYPVLFVAAATASLVDYVVNSGLVTVFVSLRTGVPIRDVVQELRIGRLSEFLLSYLGLGLVGLSLAFLFKSVGPMALPAILAPLVFARQMFFRSQALEEAHKELQDREQVLRTLSNAMAEERADERLQIAGYLHDDLAQVLFRLSIQVDVARKLLQKGQTDDVSLQLDKIRESKQETSDRIRALIRDLHRSPLGAKGLAEALESFTDEVGRDSSIRFHRDVADIDLPAPIALLVYHIAREGVMNAMKHAQPRDVWIAVREEGEDIVLSLKDNGVGFDTEAPGPEGHFGMAMMRERAQVGGGRFEVESKPGEGSTITVRFPRSLLQDEPPPDGPTQPPVEPTGGRRSGAARPASPGLRTDVENGSASPDTPGSAEPAAGDSHPTVRA
jgi:signal transduction histidine kinase